MSLENPERKFSVLQSDIKKGEESDVEKARKKRKEREGIKDESMTKLEEKLKKANESIGASDPERLPEQAEEADLENDDESMETEEENGEDPIKSFMETFERLRKEVEELEEVQEAFIEKKENILKELKDFADSKTGVDINNTQEKRVLEDTLISKLREKTERYDSAA